MKKSEVEIHFDKVAAEYDSGKEKYSYYYSNLKKLLKKLIPSKSRVYELGCGTGDLLVAVEPKSGYGMDVSREMIKIAKKRHVSKNLTFSTSWPKGKYDYIFMSDVIEHLEKPKETFKKVYGLMGKKSKFIITMANPVWEPLLMFWENMGWKMKEGPHKRLNFKELKNILEEKGFKVMKHNYNLLIPIYIPFITPLTNKYLEPILKSASFIEYVIAVKT